MENNFLSLIKTRRSVRAYKPQPVPFRGRWTLYWKPGLMHLPAEDVNPLPSLQSQTPNTGRKSPRLNAEVMGNNTDPYYGAPVVILVLADGSANTFVEDGSCVLENMMLAAHALGAGNRMGTSGT